MDSLTKLLESLSIQSRKLSHPPAASFEDWVNGVIIQEPKGLCLKTLILKPSAAKGSNGVPGLLMLIVSHSTKGFSLSSIAKSLGFKDARSASDDAVMSTFALASRVDCTPFALPAVQDKASLKVIVDDSLFKDSTVPLVFRAFSNEASIQVSAKDFETFLKSVNIEYEVLDLVNLKLGPSVAPAKTESSLATTDKDVQIGIMVKKEEDFPTWYSQVLTKTEMLDYYDVSGCYILRPWAHNIWKRIQEFFGRQIEELGVEDCYFPMFVSEKALNREKDHVEGFSPEVAWVTKAGQSDLAEPIAIRPTSETVMYPYYASWLRSHRDLPLRLNQWCNVVRWEFKHPQPFLRTREFLWQEGHTAFLTKEESDREVREILDLYRQVYEDLLAVPVIPGKKSEKEKFAGGLYTTTVEGFIPTTGRAIQGATSHCLGQNFSKMFEIMVENEDADRVHVWQNSWGLTTRTIGVMVMVHGDDKGLVLPPRIASLQVIIIPTGITVKTSDEQKTVILDKAQTLYSTLKSAGFRVKVDARENCTPGFKYNHWEMRGVPLRLEIGPKDIAKNETRAVRRDTGFAQQLSLTNLVEQVKALCDTIQSDMFIKAKSVRDAHLVQLETWDHFVETLNKKCLILAPWCEQTSCEDAVKERSARGASGDEPVDEKAPSMGAKTLCIPFSQPAPLKPGQVCFACSSLAKSYTLWGRSY